IRDHPCCAFFVQMLRPLVLLLGFVPVLATAQAEQRDTLAVRMARLRALSEQLDTLSAEEVWSDSIPTTYRMADALNDVLAIPGLRDAQLDSLMTEMYFGMTRSADGRLRIFSWDEK